MIYKEVIILDLTSKYYRDTIRLLSLNAERKLKFTKTLKEFRCDYATLLSDREMVTMIPSKDYNQDDLLCILEELAFDLKIELEIR